MMKTFLKWGAIAFLIFFIAFRPGEAADVVGSLASGILDAANGFSQFFTDLVT
jgi:hypothetical protein